MPRLVSAPVVVTLSARSIHAVVEGAVVVSVAPEAPIGVVTLLNANHAASCPPAAMATIRSSSCVVVSPVTLGVRPAAAVTAVATSSGVVAAWPR